MLCISVEFMSLDEDASKRVSEIKSIGRRWIECITCPDESSTSDNGGAIVVFSRTRRAKEVIDSMNRIAPGVAQHLRGVNTMLSNTYEKLNEVIDDGSGKKENKPIHKLKDTISPLIAGYSKSNSKFKEAENQPLTSMVNVFEITQGAPAVAALFEIHIRLQQSDIQNATKAVHEKVGLLEVLRFLPFLHKCASELDKKVDHTRMSKEFLLRIDKDNGCQMKHPRERKRKGDERQLPKTL